MKATIRLLTLLFAVSLWSIPAMAVDNIGELQMDGNAVTDPAEAPTPEHPFPAYKDWDTLMGNPDAADVFTGIKPDVAPKSIFEGGRKDIQDITMWRHKDGSVPDKDDITNAYAAAYICDESIHDECQDGEMVVYFGADRFSNTGDAFLGFWFFKDYVYDLPDGSFHGEHKAGDVLVLVNFPQGANASPEVRALAWDPYCLKEDKDLVGDDPTLPAGSNCAARNLRLLYDGVVCDDEAIEGDYACAITNTEDRFPNDGNAMLPGTIEAPWLYTAKTPDPGCTTLHCFPYESFFEGGLNVTQLVEGGGVDACFASFMVETRSSSSLTATLKDFVIDEFPLCAVEISKTCGPGYYAGGGTVVIPYEVIVENTGASDVADIVVSDDQCGDGWETIGTVDNLPAGGNHKLTGTCSVTLAEAEFLPDFQNAASAMAGDVPISEGACETWTPGEWIGGEWKPGECSASCDVDVSPAIAVSKWCETGLTMTDGLVAVEVRFGGEVKNTSNEKRCLPSGLCAFPSETVCFHDDIYDDDLCSTAPTPLFDVMVTDRQPTPTLLLAIERLEPGETASFAGSYYPDTIDDEWVCAEAAEFSDTVDASGYSIEDVYLSESVTATCTLCDVNCEDPEPEPTP